MLGEVKIDDYPGTYTERKRKIPTMSISGIYDYIQEDNFTFVHTQMYLQYTQ